LAVFTVKRAIRKRAPVQTNPFSRPTDIWDGLADYKQSCLDCHGARGATEAAFSKGLNPPAPDLTLQSVRRMGDGELYWVVSNGVRMTGMPAFSPTHSADQIWKIVAFVRHMPEMTNEERQMMNEGRQNAPTSLRLSMENR
jgi:mono/diheme cytochrome c family protein